MSARNLLRTWGLVAVAITSIAGSGCGGSSAGGPGTGGSGGRGGASGGGASGKGGAGGPTAGVAGSAGGSAGGGAGGGGGTGGSAGSVGGATAGAGGGAGAGAGGTTGGAGGTAGRGGSGGSAGTGGSAGSGGSAGTGGSAGGSAGSGGSAGTGGSIGAGGAGRGGVGGAGGTAGGGSSGSGGGSGGSAGAGGTPACGTLSSACCGGATCDSNLVCLAGATCSCAKNLFGRYLLRTGGEILFESDPTSTAQTPVLDANTGLPLSDVVGVHEGYTHGCAVQGASKTAWCWRTTAAGNSYGQLANGATDTTGPLFRATQVLTGANAPLTNVVAISSGSPDSWGLSSCAIVTGGKLYCWGNVRYIANDGSAALRATYAIPVTTDGVTLLTGVEQVTLGGSAFGSHSNDLSTLALSSRPPRRTRFGAGVPITEATWAPATRTPGNIR